MWHRAQREDSADGDRPDVYLHDPELAWRAWTMIQATGWRFLPCPGGLLDQPESLMDDIMAIAISSQQIKSDMDNG